MSRYKIIHEREICIGCGACAAVCPDFWEMAEDGKSDLKNGKYVGKNQERIIDEKDFKCNNDAAEGCPVNCIHLENLKDGKRII